MNIRTAGVGSVAALWAGMMVGCEQKAPTTNTSAPVVSDRDQPDNTIQNKRDRDGMQPTPTDQGESESDRRISAEIRRAILAEKGLSTDAQNCKIITRNGVVTLRGPVASETERLTIESKVKGVAGVSSVTSELEIKKP